MGFPWPMNAAGINSDIATSYARLSVAASFFQNAVLTWRYAKVVRAGRGDDPHVARGGHERDDVGVDYVQRVLRDPSGLDLDPSSPRERNDLGVGERREHWRHGPGGACGLRRSTPPWHDRPHDVREHRGHVATRKARQVRDAHHDRS